ncbi:MAG: NUDIX hydrolase [Defluviitaleaceae bacterium]|nr:NUDIX hydrolase [Defluviitaleaceae bacterium]
MYIEAIQNYTPKNALEAQDQRVMLEYIENYPGNVLTRENEIAHLCASGFILNEKMDKTLMIYHHLYDSWGWTGGHADGNPDLLAVAIKEAQEETGIQYVRPLSDQPQSLDILPVWSHHKKGQFINSHLHLTVSYLLIADESERLSIKADENSAVGWLPIEKIAHHCNEPTMLPIYDKLIQAARLLNN